MSEGLIFIRTMEAQWYGVIVTLKWTRKPDMNQNVSVVVLGGIGFYGIGDQAADNGTMVSTTIHVFLD